MRLLRPIKEKHAVPEPPEDGCLKERIVARSSVTGLVTGAGGRLA